MRVLIGVDPHKASPTRRRYRRRETKLAEPQQCERQESVATTGSSVLGRAVPAAGAGRSSRPEGLGYLLAPAAAGGRGRGLLSTSPATLSAARVAVLGSASRRERSQRRACPPHRALRVRHSRHVAADYHSTILRMLAIRHHQLGRCAPRPCVGSRHPLQALSPAGLFRHDDRRPSPRPPRHCASINGVVARTQSQAVALGDDVVRSGRRHQRPSGRARYP